MTRERWFLLSLVLALCSTGCASYVPEHLKTSWYCESLKCRTAFVGQPLGPGTTKYYRNECVCK